jgi:GAF domain-containing protein
VTYAISFKFWNNYNLVMKNPDRLITQAHLSAIKPSLNVHDEATKASLADLLDPAFEAAYDRLTQLATKLLRAPVALVSVASADDQFFKSFVGIGKEWTEHRVAPQSPSYCRHVVNTGDILNIEDASADEQLKNDPVTKQMGVVAYLGIPMKLQNGVTLGSFCVIDIVPRKWSQEDISIMQELNEALMREVELRLALKQAHEAKKKAEQANERVVNILSSMLDAGKPQR